MNSNHDDAFDATIRAHHAASLERVSPRVQAQLAQRRNAALRGGTVHRGHGVRYAAAGFAALCALAIGLQFGMPPAPTTTAPLVGGEAATATSVTTMLDEDPEFYAWLASPDAQQVAME
jgi:anti-sigma-K factor RskA